ncbi:response regulator [Nitrospira sp. Nam80]
MFSNLDTPGTRLRPSRVLRVLLATHHRSVRKGIRRLLEDWQDIEIVGEASTGIAAVTYAQTLKPTVIIMAIDMPNIDGIQATRLIARHHPSVTIIGLSDEKKKKIFHQAFLEAGATVILNQETAIDELYWTLITVCPTWGRTNLA